MDTLKSVLVPIHREGHKFIATFLVVAFLLFFVSDALGWLGILATAWCVYFFRDPPRVTPTRDGLVISPADGVVQMIERAVPPTELGMGEDARLRISIFMNVFNVHVNRMPVEGEVVSLAYRPGKFINAMEDKASEDNERQALRVRMNDGSEIAVVQIAGLVARRILCWVKEGERVSAGTRFGMIRFGSRLDVYLDDGMAPLVVEGQTMIAGETILADKARGDGSPMPGEER